MSNRFFNNSVPGRQRGQVFSIDLIIAMSLVILGIGLLFNAANLRAFEAKESFLTKEMQDRAQAAVIALVNGKATSCSFDSTPLAYSIDLQKTSTLYNSASGALKKYMGLQGYNVQLSVTGSSPIMNETLDDKDVVALDINVMVCTSSSPANYNNMKTIMSGGTTGNPPTRQILSLKVSR